MRYVFEDRYNDVLSILFRAAYPPCVSGEFVYAEGEGKLEAAVKAELSQFPKEDIIVFLDVVPDNRHLVNKYLKLREMYHMSTKRVIPIPIVCSEYYFIHSIVGTGVIDNLDGLEECLQIKPWSASKLLTTTDDIRFCKNFEKYCKLFLLKAVIQCAKHTRGRTEEENVKYGYYYTVDCLCDIPERGCVPASLTDKAIAYVRQYPCFPTGSLMTSGIQKIDKETVLGINAKLCALHNAKLKEFSTTTTTQPLVPLEP